MQENDYYNNIKDLIINNELNRKIKTYSITQLKNMRKFFEVFEKSPSVTDHLTYTHYCELIWFNDSNKIDYYLQSCVKNHHSVRQLRERIKSKEYERLSEDTRNKLISKEPIDIKESIPEPILIRSKYLADIEKINEKALHKYILEDLDYFLEQLGEGYLYKKSEYPIKIGNEYNYIDILLYNIKYNRYVVIELKVTKLKKEHIGQVMTYVNNIDKNLKTIYQNKTIGLIITKEDNKFIIEYSTDKNITSRTYEIV